jgi:hypothetical protein
MHLLYAVRSQRQGFVLHLSHFKNPFHSSLKIELEHQPIGLRQAESVPGLCLNIFLVVAFRFLYFLYLCMEAMFRTMVSRTSGNCLATVFKTQLLVKVLVLAKSRIKSLMSCLRNI